MEELAGWESFHVIVASAAAVLIGLQFVAMTLIAERPVERGAEAGAAFATPTIVHFSAVFLLSAELRAPWGSITPPAVLWGLLGLIGIVYAGVVARRMRRQAIYRPVFEDWFFHLLLPLAAYITLALSALAAPSHTREALFGVGAAELVLLYVSIHNAWDGLAYHLGVHRTDTHSERGVGTTPPRRKRPRSQAGRRE
jgi:hypothetical protein